jgi:hypothetical protein
VSVGNTEGGSLIECGKLDVQWTGGADAAKGKETLEGRPASYRADDKRRRTLKGEQRS